MLVEFQLADSKETIAINPLQVVLVSPDKVESKTLIRYGTEPGAVVHVDGDYQIAVAMLNDAYKRFQPR